MSTPLSPKPIPARGDGLRRMFGLLWLAGWLMVSGLLLWNAAPEPPRSETLLAGLEPAVPAVPEQPAEPQTARQFLPIEEVTLGRRVNAHNPLLSDEERNVPEPTPETHRVALFRLPKPDGSVVEAELLCPVEWLLEIGARIGGTVELDLEEQGASGPAEVLSIGPCPDIRPGEGAIVTGVFRHTAAEVLNLYVEGAEEPLGVTPNHPIWSEDRQDFIPAGDLRIGENLRTSDGRFLAVTNITSRGPPEPVYNIQVHGEHVYHVGQAGVLVHNNSLAFDARHTPRGLLPSPDILGIRIIAGGGADVRNIPFAARQRIAEVAKRRNLEIIVVGSRARGTPSAISDWDYIIIGGNSRARQSALWELPRGPRIGANSGQDLVRNQLVPDLHHIRFIPDHFPL